MLKTRGQRSEVDGVLIERIGTRVRDRKGRYQAGRERPPCGTIAGYHWAASAKRHGRENCGPCDACNEARRYYDNNRPKTDRERQRVLDRAQKRYGITFAEKLEILKAQGGVCALCGSSSPRSSVGWSTEHNHETNKIRGITCQPCNHLLGFACKIASSEDPDKMVEILGPAPLSYLRCGSARTAAILAEIRGRK